jgi:tetratricopeptide (TPR) repeat protein
MKINRHPVQELTQDVIDKDHAFWSQFSRRCIGNWITYDTSVKEVCDWAERTYLSHNFSGFTGDRKFVRDDDAQKAFSKLRSSIAASIYQWRARPQNSASPAERVRVTKEAEFAFKQAFAFCPYSPEAVFHFMDLLLNANRIDDAIMVLKTCHDLDPYNDQINSWIDQLEKSKGSNSSGGGEMLQQYLSRIQQAITEHQTNAAEQMLQQILNLPTIDANTLMEAADLYLRMGDLTKSEDTIRRLTKLAPQASGPWYNLAVVQANRGEITQAIASLQKALPLNAAEMQANPKMINFREHLFQDPSFAGLRQTPQFKAAFPGNR